MEKYIKEIIRITLKNVFDTSQIPFHCTAKCEFKGDCNNCDVKDIFKQGRESLANDIIDSL